MTYFTHATNPLGEFIEKDHGNTHEFRNSENEWGIAHGYIHEIFTRDGTRPATIKKTVAFVVVDEDENGPVVEKWNIKNYRAYD